MKKYYPRIADKLLDEALESAGAVLIEGPKWCGKTWTALNQANSACYIASPENNFQYRTMAQLSPDLVLHGESPRLLDEWQEVPALWDAVRFFVDQTPKRGQFILTGSSTPRQKGILHSGTGRIVKMRMRSMSLFESGDSSGSISLKDLFSNPVMTIQTGKVQLDQLIALTVRGGWPGPSLWLVAGFSGGTQHPWAGVVHPWLWLCDLGAARKPLLLGCGTNPGGSQTQRVR